ncbi:TetR/AcrR family transcriptional regulator [Williamsia soli]|uniref:TetR/AcrR family transcriptional regulator n=1 Tax=Williamsia soli TaxID=364929 RepID=UPI001EFFEEB4|nr:TetR family transcriptional regulator [Williamsia soli]
MPEVSASVMSAAGGPAMSYAQATKKLLRNSLLDGMRELLRTRDWSSVTMAEVARAAGVSRQTVYNEFASRQGLAEAYALRLTDHFVDQVSDAVLAHEGEAKTALAEGFSRFFAIAADDPLIQSLLTGQAKPDLLRLITTDADPLITTASARIVALLRTSWIQAEEAAAVRIARAIVRMALSYVSMPPESDRDVADDVAEIFGPVVDAAAGGGRRESTG